MSCETITDAESLVNGIVTSQRLEFDEIGRALKLLQDRLGEYENPNMSDVMIELGRAFQKSESRTSQNVTLVAASAGGALLIAYILAILLDDDDE